MYNITLDGHWAFHIYFRFEEFGISDLVSLPDHKSIRTFQTNADLKAKVSPILCGRTELIQVDIGDGVKLDGWLIKPSHFDESKKYPLILNVYGELASTMVNDSWSGIGRIFFVVLVDDGYLVGSFDNRGMFVLKGCVWCKIVYGLIGVFVLKE